MSRLNYSRVCSSPRVYQTVALREWCAKFWSERTAHDQRSRHANVAMLLLYVIAGLYLACCSSVAVWITSAIVLDAESNWLEGAFLLLVYGILAVAFFYF